uniref:Uncharacterized protein n=1 Tax=Octopus bimaculoides TaxID=37653 RepID=A0A0L8H2W7_OCTBM
MEIYLPMISDCSWFEACVYCSLSQGIVTQNREACDCMSLGFFLLIVTMKNKKITQCSF